MGSLGPGPRDLHTPVRQIRQLLEQLLGHVDAVRHAARALVLNSARGGLAAEGVVDLDGLAAHGVSVGLGTHGGCRHGDDVGGHVLAAVVDAAGAEAEAVVCEVAREVV